MKLEEVAVVVLDWEPEEVAVEPVVRTPVVEGPTVVPNPLEVEGTPVALDQRKIIRSKPNSE